MEKQFAVIFDMDGVIIDSNPVITKAWKLFFSSQNILLTDQQLKEYVFGRTPKDTLTMVMGDHLNAATIQEYENITNGHLKTLYEFEARIVPGVTDFVKSLAKDNVPLAIATSAPAVNVTVVLKMAGLESYFPIISNASHVTFSKPHPEIYLKTAEKLGVDPSQCSVRRFIFRYPGSQVGRYESNWRYNHTYGNRAYGKY